jgi:hypothetical protein
LIGAVTAAADDISEVAVSNTGKLPVKVVILNTTFGELGRSSSPDFISGNSGHGTVHLKSKVKTYHWEVFALGADGQQDKEPCDKKRDVSASSITVHCDHTMTAAKPPPPPPLPAFAETGKKWADKCLGPPKGDGGSISTCCARQRRVDANCKGMELGAPPTPCDNAEKACQSIVRE